MSEEVEMIRDKAQALVRTEDPLGVEMKTPDDLSAMIRLKALDVARSGSRPNSAIRGTRSSTGLIRAIGTPLRVRDKTV
ncbi:hypothetical protein [Methylobacterium sp. WL7]|uniref:hypothetical protein n=1 Tax=Methylobacterium sp. WL7 TaxID=2603900 RepID=UPI00164FEF0D|nr:hypothetical protein [Methylobacterium sp. WL7]